MKNFKHLIIKLAIRNNFSCLEQSDGNLCLNNGIIYSKNKRFYIDYRYSDQKFVFIFDNNKDGCDVYCRYKSYRFDDVYKSIDFKNKLFNINNTIKEETMLLNKYL